MDYRQKIFEKYYTLCNTPSDINEHLPTLFKYASKCNSVFETGVRGCVSSWALLCGLMVQKETQDPKRFLMNDIMECNIKELEETCRGIENLEVNHLWENNLTLKLPENVTYDLTFIDTLHCCGQIRRELEKFSQITNKYIIMHDTTVDEFCGEIFRAGSMKDQLPIYKSMTGFEDDDILLGMSQGIDSFLKNNKGWSVLEKFTNNNGLTVLQKNSI